MSDAFLKELRSNKKFRQGYVGNSDTFSDIEKIDLEKIPFFKVNPNLHQQFDVIWCDLFGSSKCLNWRTILDEMIRMLKQEGRLVIITEVNNDTKVCYNYQRILANVKMHLFRRIGLKCEVEFEEPKIYKTLCRSQNFNIGDKIVSVFKVERTNISLYQDRSWTFAMITGGNKVENVVKFCRSVRELDKNFVHEILICGTRDAAYDEFKVNYIDYRKYRDEFAEICKKKNDLASAATGQNLLIAHDRFILNDDFLAGFEKYGYDFDFIAPKIIDQKGNENDCWFLLGKDMFDNNLLGFGDFFDASVVVVAKGYSKMCDRDLSYSFLSGGCLIFKRDILREVRLNELIFWHQIEDWEISKEFINRGILPQMNRFSSVLNLRNDSVDFSANPIRKNLAKKIRKSLAKKFLKLFLIIKN